MKIDFWSDLSDRIKFLLGTKEAEPSDEKSKSIFENNLEINPKSPPSNYYLQEIKKAIDYMHPDAKDFIINNGIDIVVTDKLYLSDYVNEQYPKDTIQDLKNSEENLFCKIMTEIFGSRIALGHYDLNSKKIILPQSQESFWIGCDWLKQSLEHEIGHAKDDKAGGFKSNGISNKINSKNELFVEEYKKDISSVSNKNSPYVKGATAENIFGKNNGENLEETFASSYASWCENGEISSWIFDPNFKNCSQFFYKVYGDPTKY